MDFEKFFMEYVPDHLKHLNADARPEWGSLKVAEMLDHLRKGIELSLMNIDMEIVTPAEHLPAYKEFLMSDKLFKKGSPQPQAYSFITDFKGDLEELKVNLMKSVVKMLSYFENNPEHTSIHPNFGKLNVEEWLQLHRKHFTHHFTQFGLITS